MTAADPRICCPACADWDADGLELCEYPFCECHNGIIDMDDRAPAPPPGSHGRSGF